MAKGKFEGGRTRVSGGKAHKVARKERKLWPILAAAAGALIVIVGAVLLIHGFGEKQPKVADDKIAPNVMAAGVDLSGMTRDEALDALEQAAAKYEKSLVLTLELEEAETEEPTAEPTETEPTEAETTDASEADGETEPEEEDEEPSEEPVPTEPVTLTFAPAETGAKMDAKKALDAAYRVGRELALPAEGEHYTVPAKEFLELDEEYIRSLTDETAAAMGAGDEASQNEIRVTKERREVEVELEDGKTEKQQKDVEVLHIKLGTAAVNFTADELFDAVMDAYAAAEFAPVFRYARETPEALNLDKLFEQYCTPAEDAVYDVEKHEIVPEVLGYGFDKKELKKLLKKAKPGEEVEIVLQELQPEITAQKLEDQLFSDVLASVDTAHTWDYDRTTNLTLACKAIDGTVVMPDEVFSFNKTVGIRTEEKGYRPAIAYVAGGESKPEVGGGICQVASSIYYATLLADLETVERAEHMYAVTYVPLGMDATIYYGSLDFKFRNTTDYPLRIDASVSDGYVHIQLIGTNDRDYTVEMTYTVLETIPWEVEEVEVKPGDEFKPGEVICTAYTGYKVVTYMHKYDMDGNEISVTKVATSNYSKRNRKIAVAAEEETTEPTPEPTQEPTPEPTQEPTPEPTQEPTPEPTEEPTTEPTPTEEEPSPVDPGL